MSNCTSNVLIFQVSAKLCTCTCFLVYFRIAETDAEVQKRLRKWDKFLESGDVGAEHPAGKNRGKADIIKENVTSAKNEQEDVITNPDIHVELSEKKTEDNADKHMEINDESKVGKLEEVSVEGSSDCVIEEGSRSSAGSSDDTEGHRSEDEENGEDSTIAETG
jgi:hypothetical protein